MNLKTENLQLLVILCTIITLANAAPVPNAETSAIEERDFDCSAKRGLMKRQCPGSGGGCA